MSRIKKGDLVKMHTHDTGHVGIVVDMHPHANHPRDCQVGIKWFKGSGKVDYEPESWLEIVSASR